MQMLIRRALFVLLLVGVPVLATAQATKIQAGANLPTHCTVGNIYLKTGSSAGIYECPVTDTWVGPSTADQTITVSVTGQTSLPVTSTLELAAGSNVTLTTDNAASPKKVTIAASGGGGGSPGGSGTQAQYRIDASTFGGMAGSSWTAALLGGTFNVPTMQNTNGFAMTVPAPVVPNTAPVLAGNGGGLLSNGVYRYKFTYTTTHGETLPSAATAVVTVVDNSTDGQVSVTIPLYLQQSTFPSGLNVYRTVAGGSTYKLNAAGINAFASIYTDNVADVDLGANAPTVSTAIEAGYVFSDDGVLTPPFPSTLFGGSILRLGPGAGFTQTTIMPATLPNQDGVSLFLQGGYPNDNCGLPDDTCFGIGGNVNIAGGVMSPYGDPDFRKGGDVLIAGGYGQGVAAKSGSVFIQDGNSSNRIVVNPLGVLTFSSSATATFNSSVTASDFLVSTTSIVPLRGVTGTITGALTLGNCDTGTASVTGARAGMVVVANYTTDPGGLVQPAKAYVSANDVVTVSVCALGIVTPSVIAQVAVLR